MAKFKIICGLVNLVLTASIIFALFYFDLFIVSEKNAVGSDFVSFITGARIVKEGIGDALYDINTQAFYQQKIIKPYESSNLLPFRNQPLVAALFIPFTYLSLLQGYKVYVFLSTCVLVFISLFAAGIFENSKKNCFYHLFLFIFLPNVVAIYAGQLALIISLFFLIIYKLIKTKRYFWVGFVSGLLIIKIQYILAVPFLLLLSGNKRSFLAGCFSSFLLIFLSSLILVGPKSLITYPSFLFHTENLFFGSRPWQMFTFDSLMIFVTGSYALRPFFLTLNAAFYSLVLLVFSQKKEKVSFDSSFASVLLFTLVFSIHVLIHDLSISLISALVLLNRTFEKKTFGKAFLPMVLTMVIFTLPVFSFLRSAPLASLGYLLVGFYLLNQTNTALYD